MKTKKIITLTFLVFILLCLTSCAPSGATEYQYGFFGGLWHGIIYPISIWGSMFGFNGAIATFNTGFTYYLGFGFSILIDIIILVGLSNS